jgi:type IV secretion system protein VirB10
MVSWLLAGGTVWAQQPASPQEPATQAPASSPAPAVASPGNPAVGTTAAAQPAPANQQPGDDATQQQAPEPKTYEVPAGTKVLLSLKSAVNTRSARVGDGVYLVSSFPVVVGNRVMIPAGVYVQGQVDRVVPPGHGWKRGELAMHFTSMIFPNGTVVTIPGTVSGLPGSAGPRMKNGDEGTIQGEGNGGRIGGDVAKGAEIGATPGVIVGAVKGAPITGLGVGGAAGAVGGLIYSLLTRGKDVNIEAGSQIEMVLQRSLLLREANLDGPEMPGATPLVPVGEHKHLEKPERRPRILCPTGVPCS